MCCPDLITLNKHKYITQTTKLGMKCKLSVGVDKPHQFKGYLWADSSQRVRGQRCYMGVLIHNSCFLFDVIQRRTTIHFLFSFLFSFKEHVAHFTQYDRKNTSPSTITQDQVKGSTNWIEPTTYRLTNWRISHKYKQICGTFWSFLYVFCGPIHLIYTNFWFFLLTGNYHFILEDSVLRPNGGRLLCLHGLCFAGYSAVDLHTIDGIRTLRLPRNVWSLVSTKSESAGPAGYESCYCSYCWHSE